MKIIFFLIVSSVTFSLQAQDLTEFFDDIFEQHDQMMQEMRDMLKEDSLFKDFDQLRHRFGQLGGLTVVDQLVVKSKIIREADQWLEVVSIESPHELVNLKIDVSSMIHLQASVSEKKKTRYGEISSQSMVSQVIKKPEGGEYLPDRTLREKKKVKLYFRVKKGKEAENWLMPQKALPSPPPSLQRLHKIPFPEDQGEDPNYRPRRGEIVPQKTI